MFYLFAAMFFIAWLVGLVSTYTALGILAVLSVAMIAVLLLRLVGRMRDRPKESRSRLSAVWARRSKS
jgi:membrane protein implicated in regulation of membrane protease activity